VPACTCATINRQAVAVAAALTVFCSSTVSVPLMPSDAVVQVMPVVAPPTNVPQLEAGAATALSTMSRAAVAVTTTVEFTGTINP
jgi:hypothetical protein